METLTFFGIVFAGVMIGSGAMLFALRDRIRAKPKRKPAKDRGAWLTRHQLVILESIARSGSAGVSLWKTDISGATIRSLAKRGFLDTRSGGRIVVTHLGRKRLRQPWPAEQSAGDQKDRVSADGSGVSSVAPVASGDSSQADALTEQGQ